MTAKSNAREGDGVAALIAKWREQYEMHGLEWDAGYNRARTTCADELEAAMQAQQGAEPVAWQPIESAPKSGKVDVMAGGQRYTGCYWDSICGEYRTTGNSNVLISLPLRVCTHWMPIPAAPATGAPR